MKQNFFRAFLFLFLAELAALAWLALSREERAQERVAVNEIVKTVQKDWNSLEKHRNLTPLDYVVADREGRVLYRTREGLSETINDAIRHKDTILDIEIDGTAVGKIIIYNDDIRVFRREKQVAILAVLALMLLQGGICAGYFFYLQRVIVRPFGRMKDFAERIAGGNLDLPLEMDRQNLFGAFTESFDLMRSELKKARIAEAKANESKKELVAKLSHDIKTPVASIKAASEVGAALSATEKDRENYEQIIQKADQINTLVTNLISATMEELHELSVTPTELKSGELRELLESADYLHQAVIPPPPACLLSADRLRLQQVFDNLFANSYKYAGTKIDVAFCMEEGYLTVSIEDFGGGVEASELPLLKEKYKRGSNAGKVEGAGLGLYIADYCMEKMEGALWITNGPAGLRADVRIRLCSGS